MHTRSTASRARALYLTIRAPVIFRFPMPKEILTLRKFPRTLSLLPRIARNLSITLRRSLHMIVELGKVTEETQNDVFHPGELDDRIYQYVPG